jgi:hypothetical protein
MGSRVNSQKLLADLYQNLKEGNIKQETYDIEREKLLSVKSSQQQYKKVLEEGNNNSILDNNSKSKNENLLNNVLKKKINFIYYLVIVLALQLMYIISEFISYGYDSYRNQYYILSVLFLLSSGLYLYRATQFARRFVFVMIFCKFLLPFLFFLQVIQDLQPDASGLNFGLLVFSTLFDCAVYGFGLYLINKLRKAEKVQ